MIFWMNSLQIAFLTLSMKFPVIISFPDAIEFCSVGAHEKHFSIQHSKDKKTFVLKALMPKIDSTLTCVAKGESYTFQIQSGEEAPSKYPVKIKRLPDDFKEENAYKLKKSGRKWRLLEGEKTYLFINSGNNVAFVNEKEVAPYSKYSFGKAGGVRIKALH